MFDSSFTIFCGGLSQLHDYFLAIPYHVVDGTILEVEKYHCLKTFDRKEYPSPLQLSLRTVSLTNTNPN